MAGKCEDKYRILFDTSRDAIMTLEPPSWAFTSGNPSTIRMFACKDEADFTSRAPWQYSPPKQPDGKPSGDKAKAMIMRAMEEGSNFFEWTHRRLTGEDFPATVLLTRVEEGGRAYLQATVRDITLQTELKRRLEVNNQALQYQTRAMADNIKSLAGYKHQLIATQNALKESETKFKAIFEGAVDGIIAADAKTRKFEFANSGMCRITGYPLKELLALGVMQIHPKKDLPYVLDQFKKQAEGKITLAKDIPVLRKDGSVVYCEVNSQPVQISGKEYVIGLFRDITEQKKAGEALRKSEKELKALFEGAPDGIIFVDANGTLLSINNAMTRMTGYTAKDLVGKRFTALKMVTPKGLATAAAALVRGVAGREQPRFEIEIKAKSGKTMVLDISSALIREGGKVVGGVGILRDLTTVKQAGEELRESESKYRELFEGASDAIVIIDTVGRFLDVNRKLEEESGYKKSEVVGKSILTMGIVTKESLLRIMMNIQDALRSGKRKVFEMEGVTKNGTIINYENTSVPIMKNGKIVAFHAILRNITERKELERQLAASNKALRTQAQDMASNIKALAKANKELGAKRK